MQANSTNNQNSLPAQIELFTIPSPCVGVCTTDKRGLCIGCLRSRDERFNWLYFSTEEKREVIRKCTNRKKRIAYAKYKERIAEQHKHDQENPTMGDLFD